jgi:hypothetical protein
MKAWDGDSEEFFCERKMCEDRTPWVNKSCSVKEDFTEEGGPLSCYYLKVKNFGTEMCVVGSNCPNDYPGV